MRRQRRTRREGDDGRRRSLTPGVPTEQPRPPSSPGPSQTMKPSWKAPGGTQSERASEPEKICYVEGVDIKIITNDRRNNNNYNNNNNNIIITMIKKKECQLLEALKNPLRSEPMSTQLTSHPLVQ